MKTTNLTATVATAFVFATNWLASGPVLGQPDLMGVMQLAKAQYRLTAGEAAQLFDALDDYYDDYH